VAVVLVFVVVVVIVVVALEFAVVVSLSSRSVHGGGRALWQVALGCVVVVVVVVVFGVVMALWGHRTYRNLPKGRIFPKPESSGPGGTPHDVTRAIFTQQ
jgi:amino acid transporter